MADVTDWIRLARSSHNRFTELVTSLDTDQLSGPSYDDEWSIAQVASHLGSQAEIFSLFFDAVIAGEPVPGNEVFGPIWDRWNAMTPADQASSSVAANEEAVARFEQLTPAQRDAFHIDMFGQSLDLAGFLALRMSEHAIHTWDIAVAVDPTAAVADDAVELLIDKVSSTAARGGKSDESPQPIAVRTSDPDRTFLLSTSPAVALDPGHGDDPLALPAEALIRLVYGRLDDEHTPDEVEDPRLDRLRAVFPGF